MGDQRKRYAADLIVKKLSTWGFTAVSTTLVFGWCVLNWLMPERFQYDPYPFIFLNFIVSLWAMLQNQFIMISQDRLQEGDRQLAQESANDTKQILNRIKHVEDKLYGKLEVIEDHVEDDDIPPK